MCNNCWDNVLENAKFEKWIPVRKFNLKHFGRLLRWNVVVGAMKKSVIPVDLVKSFRMSSYHLLAKIGVDTAENEPLKDSIHFFIRLLRRAVAMPAFGFRAVAVPAVGGRAVAVAAVGTSARSVALLESSKSFTHCVHAVRIAVGTS